MKKENFTFKDEEGVEIYTYRWLPDDDKQMKGIVQISHGMAEKGERYERFAEELTRAGYGVYCNDHRGHGNTAGSVEKLGYLADADGFNWLVKDMHELTNIIKKENGSLPVFLFGHSMGSFLTQKYISEYGTELRGAILSGTNGKAGIIADIGLIIAKNECKKIGRKSKSEKLNKMSFGSYNNSFKPTRTEFDWLSRDEKEVDKYINDPYCGTVFTAGFFYDFLLGLKDIHRKQTMAKIPRDLPIYIFGGEKDPVGRNSKGVIQLINMYKKLNINSVDYKIYKDGRHEMLNEINRDEVMKDTINWLNAHI